jgi:IS30 family transposase
VFNKIKRNSDNRRAVYNPDLANRKAAKPQTEKTNSIHCNRFIQEEVALLLRDDYSPEQVVGILPLKWKNKQTEFKLHSLP